MEENKNVVAEEVEVQEESYKSGSIQYIDSREVAEMVGKRHPDLKRDIKRYINQLDMSKIAHINFFTDSTYRDSENREQSCYLVTLKGCEFIAHKLTGQKGTEFTARYINRFHEMEDALNIQIIPVLQQFMERQSEFNHTMLEKLNDIQTWQKRGNVTDPILEIVKGENASESARRRSMLNQLVGKMAKVCGWDKNFALHRLYKTLEDVLDISLDDYQEIYRAETGNMNISTLGVILEYDRLYKTAVRLCTNTINDMKC